MTPNKIVLNPSFHTHMIKIIFLLLPTLFFMDLALAIENRIAPATRFESEIVNIPMIDAVTEVDVGESIVQRIFKTTKPGIELARLPKILKVPALMFGTYDVSLKSKKMPLYSRTKNGDFYLDSMAIINDDTIQSLAAGALFIPTNTSESLEACIIFKDRTLAKCATTSEINFKEDIIPTSFDSYQEGSFKRELLFGGVSGTTLTIMYREFTNDMARPAFSQELKYDIATDKIIGYRGSRFEVIKAGNSGLQYKVIKYLN